MTPYMKYLPMAIALMGFFNLHAQSPRTVQLTGLDAGGGQVILAFFDSKASFDAQKNPAHHRIVTQRKGETVREVVLDIEPGGYALAVFQDINSNGKLDKNWMGIPQEPYGFSGGGNYRWGAPAFEEARIEWHGVERVSIGLIRF
jgi:uncharacterized protein (DUF2141 family)